VASGHQLRIVRERDWSVFHFPGWASPVAMVWNKPGHERLFVTRVDGTLPGHEEALKKIDEWVHSDWTTHRNEYGGLSIPLAVHEKCVLVPEAGDIQEEEGGLLTIEPPCIFWFERQDHAHNAASIAAVVTIR